MNSIRFVLMMRLFVSWFAMVVCASAYAEIVTTTDGRQLELNTDGTFRVLETVQEQKMPIEQQEPFFTHHVGEYNQRTIRFMPIVKNVSEKTIVGFRFTTEFRSAFGDEVYSFSGESSERIQAGALSTAKAFYFFEDNQFMNGQPYDKLKIFEAAGTGKIETSTTAIVFEDGEVLKPQ